MGDEGIRHDGLVKEIRCLQPETEVPAPLEFSEEAQVAVAGDFGVIGTHDRLTGGLPAGTHACTEPGTPVIREFRAAP